MAPAAPVRPPRVGRAAASAAADSIDSAGSSVIVLPGPPPNSAFLHDTPPPPYTRGAPVTELAAPLSSPTSPLSSPTSRPVLQPPGRTPSGSRESVVIAVWLNSFTISSNEIILADLPSELVMGQ